LSFLECAGGIDFLSTIKKAARRISIYGTIFSIVIDFFTLYGAGSVYKRLEKPKEALNYIERALTIKPDNLMLNDIK